MTIPLGFATGSNLTDLGRNLVAQETTRNALQAALAAAAAQQGVARTQAGASRYSTDAQREGNQLMAMLRGLENDRLREATNIEAGLKGRDIDLRKFLGEQQFAPNTPAERDLDRKARIRETEIIAEAQRAANQRVDPRFASTLLEANLELDQIIKALPGLETMANAKSDSLFNSRGDWRYGDAREKADYQTLAFDITSDPKYGAFGKYLIPTIMPDGRVRFKANPPSLLPVPGASVSPTLPPLPPPELDEVESALGGSTVPTVPVRPLNVPRGTNEAPTLPMLPVTQDTELGFFSKLGGLTDRSPIAQLAQLIGRSSVRTPDAPATPAVPVSAAPPIVSLAETIRQQSPLTELVPIIDFDPGRTSRTSPNSAGEAESIVLGYIDNLAKEIQRLNQLPAQRGTESRKVLVIKELSRLRQLMPSLN